MTSRSSWGEWAKALDSSMESDSKALLEFGVDKSKMDTWKAAIKNSAELGVVLEGLRDALGELMDEDSLDPDHVTPSQNTLKAAKSTMASLNTLLDSSRSPFSPEGTKMDSFTSLRRECESFNGGAQRERQLQNSLALVRSLVDDLFKNATKPDDDRWQDKPPTTMKDLLNRIYLDLQVASKRFERSFASEACHAGGGK